jgi:YesN/AraC family two-component response regulator
MKSMTVGRYVPGVLVVDDDPLVRSFLRDALATHARVVEAEDGEQAIEILHGCERQTLDLALVDHILPKRSGLEILQVAKRTCSWLPVVLITGFGSEELAVNALRGGAVDYLRKPIQLEALLRLVAELTARPHIASAGRTRGDPEGHAPAVHPSIQKSLVFMREHFAETVTLSDVAREAGLSRFHFCRLFHYETGVSFHEYLRDLRVAQAKALLANRYLRVSEIAYTVGFNDMSHFAKMFRKLVGYSPSEYRRSMQLDGDPASRLETA